jgi:apolipoprotein N-acyltransferase
MHLYIPVATALAWWLRKRRKLTLGASLIAVAILHSLFERMWPTSIFPWNLGYPLLWGGLSLAQWADVVGFAGLSTMLLLLNAWVAWLWNSRSNIRRVSWNCSVILIIFAALSMGAQLRARPWRGTDGQLNALVVQANIGNREKIRAEKGKAFQREIIDRFISLSQKGLQNAPETELLVWPETAFPGYLDDSFAGQRLQLHLKHALKALGRPLLTGAYSKESNAFFNAMFLVDSGGELLSPPYRKTILLAFGEYLPFSGKFPILREWLPFVANFGRGQGPMVFSLLRTEKKPLLLGGQICYEGLFKSLTRGLAAKGARILVNVTNDSWFGDISEPWQHLYMTFAQAIETRRPLLRVTNTGISSAIMADGTILDRSPLREEWTGLYKIGFLEDPPQSFYVSVGHLDWIVWLAIVLIIFLKRSESGRTHDSDPVIRGDLGMQ